MSTARIKPITTPVIKATDTDLNGAPSGDDGVSLTRGTAGVDHPGGWQYVRATCQVTDDVAADFAEYRFWTRDRASMIWTADNSINGNGRFRAVKGTDNDAVSETLHVVGADRVYLQQTDRTDAAVRSNAYLTLVNDPQV